MKLVRSALGYRVGDAARGTAILCRVVRGIYLKLTNRALTDYIVDPSTSAFFGEEGLVVVAAIHGVVVQQSGDAAETNQTKVRVGNGARREQRKIRPALAINRQFIY